VNKYQVLSSASRSEQYRVNPSWQNKIEANAEFNEERRGRVGEANSTESRREKPYQQVF